MNSQWYSALLGNAGGLGSTTTGTSTATQLQQQGAQNAGNITWTAPASNPIAYTTYPSIPQAPSYVPVIPEDHPDRLHFLLKDGTVHSFAVGDILIKLGLRW